MLPPHIKELIETIYGHKVRYPRDCDGLSADILAKTNDRISPSTLKRLFGFVKAQNYPNQHTLDVIATYLGYTEWKEVPGSQSEPKNIIETTTLAEKITDKPNPQKRKWLFVLTVIGIVTIGFFALYPRLSRSNIEPKPDNFTTLPDLPEVRGGGRVVSHDHHIYFLGGSDAEFMRDNNWRYDTIAKQWEILQPIPTPRAEIGCAIFNEIIYCFGGWRGTDSGAANAAEAYDIRFNTWETLPPLPYALTSAYAVTIDSCIYILGGTLGETKNYFFRYNIAERKYDNLSTYTTSRNLAALVVINNSILAIGGQSFTGGAYQFHDNVDEYNIVEDKWKPQSPMPTPLSRFGFAVADEQVYILGGTEKFGEDTCGLRNYLFVYNSTLKSWSNEGEIPLRLCGHASIAIANELYILGGNAIFPNPEKLFLRIKIK